MAPRPLLDRRSMVSRGFAEAGALMLALALLPSSALVGPGDALAATARVGPFGTATIDGVQAPKAKKLIYRSPVTGHVIIFDHSPD